MAEKRTLAHTKGAGLFFLEQSYPAQCFSRILESLCKIPQRLTPHLCFSILLLFLLESLIRCLQLLDFPPVPTKQVWAPPRIPLFNSKDGYLTDAPDITGDIYCNIFTMNTGQVIKGMKKSSRNFSTVIFCLLYSLTNHTSLEQCLAYGMLLWSIFTINIVTQMFLNEYIFQ